MISRNLTGGAPHAVVPLCPRHIGLDSLLVRVGAGDRGAFAAFYDAMSQTVYGMSLSEGHGAALSTQITADVFLMAWQQSGAFDPGDGSAWTWVRAIAREALDDQSRKQRSTSAVRSRTSDDRAAHRRYSHV